MKASKIVLVFLFIFFILISMFYNYIGNITDAIYYVLFIYVILYTHTTFEEWSEKDE